MKKTRSVHMIYFFLLTISMFASIVAPYASAYNPHTKRIDPVRNALVQITNACTLKGTPLKNKKNTLSDPLLKKCIEALNTYTLASNKSSNKIACVDACIVTGPAAGTAAATAIIAIVVAAFVNCKFNMTCSDTFIAEALRKANNALKNTPYYKDLEQSLKKMMHDTDQWAKEKKATVWDTIQHIINSAKNWISTRTITPTKGGIVYRASKEQPKTASHVSNNTCPPEQQSDPTTIQQNAKDALEYIFNKSDIVKKLTNISFFDHSFIFNIIKYILDTYTTAIGAAIESKKIGNPCEKIEQAKKDFDRLQQLNSQSESIDGANGNFMNIAKKYTKSKFSDQDLITLNRIMKTSRIKNWERIYDAISKYFKSKH